MPELVNVILLGIIEGITEFLPISSTGHLLIAEHWLGQRSDLFNTVIQAGTMVAVTIVYQARLGSMLMNLQRPENRSYALRLAIAFGITVILGLAAKKAGISSNDTCACRLCSHFGGVWILAAEWWASRKKPQEQITWTAAVLVGVAQVIAGIFPGTSRSAATIFGAMFAGTTDRAAATEFAFLVGIPTMYAASVYEVYDQSKIGFMDERWGLLGVAFVTSMVVAFVAVKWLLSFIRTHSFVVFAWYRILFGSALLAFATTV